MMEKVERYYDEEYDEWLRLARHKIEFDITKRYLDKYLTEPGLKIFDIGGGPGRYALYLAEKGHRVSLLDLSYRHIQVAKAESAKRGLELEAYLHGNALHLENYARDFDVVLLMGPLYHLIKEADRKKSLAGALARLKTGGLIFAAFISCYAPLHDYLKYLRPLDSPQELLAYAQGSENKAGEGFTTAYFTGPGQARELMSAFNLRELAFVAVENVLSSREQEINALEDAEYKKWLEVCYQLSQDPNLWGTGEHFLYIGRKEKA